MRSGADRGTCAIWLAAMALAAASAGCAPLGPVELPPAPASRHVSTPSATPGGGAAAPLPGAPGDTVPSAAARAVLASIPEPLPDDSPAAQVPLGPDAPAAVGDSTFASTPAARAVEPAADAIDTVAVPVPSPTTPLGGGTPVTLPQTPPPELPAPSSAVTPQAPAKAPASATPDTCWRVQVGAPAERARGSRLRDVAQSQLLIPMVVEQDAGRWKVRSRECLTRLAAESLRERAVATGFKGVFLVRYVGRH